MARPWNRRGENESNNESNMNYRHARDSLVIPSMPSLRHVFAISDTARHWDDTTKCEEEKKKKENRRQKDSQNKYQSFCHACPRLSAVSVCLCIFPICDSDLRKQCSYRKVVLSICKGLLRCKWCIVLWSGCSSFFTLLLSSFLSVFTSFFLSVCLSVICLSASAQYNHNLCYIVCVAEPHHAM